MLSLWKADGLILTSLVPGPGGGAGRNSPRCRSLGRHGEVGQGSERIVGRNGSDVCVQPRQVLDIRPALACIDPLDLYLVEVQVENGSPFLS
jgi:hypothetical protein